jgi:KDO2-lipid IV(A) lauroyltransferase
MSDLTDKRRNLIALESLKHTGLLFFEAAKIWKKCKGEQYISNIFGEEKVKQTLAQGKGVLITGAHIGNWEVALHYLGSRYPFHCMYRPPRQQEMDEVINHGRCKNSTTMVKGDSRGVMHLIKILKAGEVAAVLSDQEPGRRAGVFVPFCGKDALTMTLVQKIQQKSDAALFQIAAIKNETGAYDVHLEPLDIDSNQEEACYAEAVNESLASMIKRYPAQYQWSYKRFKTTECGRPNPYCE